MPVYPISSSALDAIDKTHDPNKPIFMLNLWRFRPTALYPPEHAHLSPPPAGTPCTGREATERYRAAIQAVLPPNASIHFVGNCEGMVAGPEGETWDWVALVRYESLKGFRDMVESVRYKEEVEPFRNAGLEEWRLVALEGTGGVGVGLEGQESG
ncbi:hypothetical protein BU25DRAFT_454489 [Macroventuria anomochaeta]|uniref:Uncharacterized protein n=1 Tax=Macroventuria anomochaeta TaxID=301207 RepID=A0ACB6SFK9_9PLEO|nr:uncharacterized protein BU25DRAFT_454489 [Macroventuria anomochaeta]KAF2632123.1 hypothetical protein BU25DRAFT_454489 [Macroventuria anomochaeta]